MGRTNYKCPTCGRFNGLNGAYHDGDKDHCCKHCGCKVVVKVKGTCRWFANWVSVAVKRV